MHSAPHLEALAEVLELLHCLVCPPQAPVPVVVVQPARVVEAVQHLVAEEIADVAVVQGHRLGGWEKNKKGRN